MTTKSRSRRRAKSKSPTLRKYGVSVETRLQDSHMSHEDARKLRKMIKKGEVT